jgi:hypothetical protein
MKELVVFETTLATADSPESFGRAVEEGRRQLAIEVEDRFNYAIDIRQARARGIHPPAGTAPAPAEAGPADQRSRVIALDSSGWSSTSSTRHAGPIPISSRSSATVYRSPCSSRTSRRTSAT